jgi:hypothetical protein
LYNQIRDAAGNERGVNVTASNELNVIESGLTGLILADDAAFTPATSKVLPIGAEADDTSPDSVDEGDIGALRMSLRRELYNQIRDAAGNERGVNVTASNELNVVQPCYTSATTSNRVEEIDPVSAHHNETTLIDETNITTNTTTYAYIDMDGYRYFTLQGETSDAAPTDVLTVTVEASVQDDGTAQASCAYQDVTSALFGVASAIDADFMWICDSPVAFKYVRVKYVTSNDAGNDADLTVYAKKMF